MPVIATLDFETDPFLAGRPPVPFAWGYYDGTTYTHHWGDDAVAALVKHLRSITVPTIAFAHNGGKFDFMYFLKECAGKMMILNTRVAQAFIGNVELRDSWNLIPEPLDKATKGKKIKIDYTKMEREVREANKSEILTYMKADVIELHNLVAAFFAEFGNKLTIGGTAMRELRRHHEIETGYAGFDEEIRQYYYGGRCQVFKPGVHHGRFMMVDLNSAYADAMDKLEHPVGLAHGVGSRITSKTDFAIVEAENDGVLCMRTKEGLSFDIPFGTFFTTRHEIEAGEETGRLKIKRVLKTLEFGRKTTFHDFVSHFTNKKIQAELEGNQILRDFYKRVINSSYGKFAQNPENHSENCLTGIGDPPPLPQYHPSMNEAETVKAWRISAMAGDYIIWERPSARRSYYNVATAASITGAVRATLLRGIHSCQGLLYCDTDSLICEAFEGNIHETELGAWKHERFASEDGGKKHVEFFDCVAIAGRKLYACFHNGRGVKKASKGGNVPFDDIRRVAEGGEFLYSHPAPVFKLDGRPHKGKRNAKLLSSEHGGMTVQFVSRVLRRTGKLSTGLK